MDPSAARGTSHDHFAETVHLNALSSSTFELFHWLYVPFDFVSVGRSAMGHAGLANNRPRTLQTTEYVTRENFALQHPNTSNQVRLRSFLSHSRSSSSSLAVVTRRRSTEVQNWHQEQVSRLSLVEGHEASEPNNERGRSHFSPGRSFHLSGCILTACPSTCAMRTGIVRISIANFEKQ